MSNYMYLSTDELVLINILNTMYNDNYRQIEQLQDSNTRIMTSIINILTNVLHTRTRNRQGTPANGTSTASNRRENNTSPITNTTTTSNPNPNSVRRINSTSTSSSNGLLSFLNSEILRNSSHTTTNPSQSSFRSGINELIQGFLEPIEVFPTQSQIEIATRIVRFSDIVNPINSSCPISMERFNDSDNVSIIRECGHIFSTQEINLWFRSNCRCPICRYDIRNYNPQQRRNVEGNVEERNQTPSDSVINDMSNNIVPTSTNDMSNNIVPTSNDMSNNIVPTSTNDLFGSISSSNIVFTVPYISDMSGNNLNTNDIASLLINYYTRGV